MASKPNTSTERLSKADWLGLAIFALPVAIAAAHSIAGAVK